MSAYMSRIPTGSCANGTVWTCVHYSSIYNYTGAFWQKTRGEWQIVNRRCPHNCTPPDVKPAKPTLSKKEKCACGTEAFIFYRKWYCSKCYDRENVVANIVPKQDPKMIPVNIPMAPADIVQPALEKLK